MPKNVFAGDSYNQDGEVADANDVNKYGLYGDGSDGSYTSGDNLTPGKVYNFTDFTLNQGDTLSSTASNSGEPIIVKVQGDVDISGTIDLSGQGFAGGAGSSGFDRGGSGNGEHSIVHLKGINSQGDNAQFSLNPGTGGKGAVSTGTVVDLETIPGRKYLSENYFDLKTGVIDVPIGTGGGGGGAVESSNDSADGGAGGASYLSDGNNGGAGGDGGSTDTGLDGGAGGDGGGSIIFLAAGNVDFSGTIDVTGGNGFNGDANLQGAGGGGGGGAGNAYIVYGGSLTDNGTKNSSGGLGGSGGTGSESSGGDGGDGANGTILFESVS